MSLKEHAKNFFGRRAEFWDVQYIPTNAQELSRIIIDKAGIKDGDCVLDLATGTGFQAVQIAYAVGRKGKVIGVDLSQSMLREAKKKVKKLGLESIIELCKADSENIPLKDNSVDAMICGFAYHHFPYPYTTAEESFRVLKPWKKAVIVDGCRPHWSYFKRIITDLYVKITDKSSKIRFYCEDEFRSFLRKAKFRDIHSWSFYQIHSLICPFVIVEGKKYFNKETN